MQGANVFRRTKNSHRSIAGAIIFRDCEIFERVRRKNFPICHKYEICSAPVYVEFREANVQFITHFGCHFRFYRFSDCSRSPWQQSIKLECSDDELFTRSPEGEPLFTVVIPAEGADSKRLIIARLVRMFKYTCSDKLPEFSNTKLRIFAAEDREGAKNDLARRVNVETDVAAC